MDKTIRDRIDIQQGDITRLAVDAIDNTMVVSRYIRAWRG